jgi:ethanolaminephosphotransferase
LSVFLITQTRVTNIPLFLLFYLQLQILGLLNLGSDDITLTSILFQYASFFAFGGSNAISSVDLSNGYNGIDGYNVLAVGILTFASNWAGPIWWASATNLLLLQADRCKFERHVALLTLFVAFHIFFVMLACSLLKTHLFIWTVFSPKYLFSMAWSLGQHACINILFSGLHFWFGSPERVRG